MTTTQTKPKVHRTNPETRAAIIGKWLSGQRNGTQIGREVGFTQATVFLTLEKAGLYTRKRVPQRASKKPQHKRKAIVSAPVIKGQTPVVPMPVTMAEPERKGFFSRIWSAIKG